MSTKSALIDAGSSADLAIGLGGVQADDWATLELSRLPSVNFSQNINYLLSYPHGCTEQVTSQGFPLLYIDEFASLSDEQQMRIKAKVDEVIRILSSRQLPDGGFTYWDGTGYASEWVSTYAGHFLVEAKNRGYDVSESIVSRWVQFQRKLAQNWIPTTPYHHYYTISMIDLQQAYRLYALALNGNAELGAMNRMRELPELSLQARWRLAAAYALAGRHEAANELVFNASSDVEPYGFNNDTYGTPARDQAMILETYLLLGQDEKAMQLAQTVAKALSSAFVSTQTAAFGLAAMAQLAEKMGKGNINVDWSLNGKKMDAVNTPKAMFQTEIRCAANLSVNVSNKGQGKIYARLTASTQPMIDTLIIFALSVVLWALVSFPAPPAGAAGAAIDYSFAGTIGHFIEPLFAPLGFTWQMCIAMIPGIAAREVVVAALGTVYAVGAGSEDAVQNALIPIVHNNWGLPTAFAFLAWYIYAPMCMATLAVIKRETKSARQTFMIAAYLFALAYVFAFVVYQVTSRIL